MVEVVAAVIGAMIGVAGMTAGNMIRKSGQSRDVITKLSMGIEHIGCQLQAMREDMKEDRHEVFSRLSTAEQRISALEASKRRW